MKELGGVWWYPLRIEKIEMAISYFCVTNLSDLSLTNSVSCLFSFLFLCKSLFLLLLLYNADCFSVLFTY